MKSMYDFLSKEEREWVGRCQALAIVLIVVFLGLLGGFAFGVDRAVQVAAAAPWPATVFRSSPAADSRDWRQRQGMSLDEIARRQAQDEQAMSDAKTVAAPKYRASSERRRLMRQHTR